MAVNQSQPEYPVNSGRQDTRGIIYFATDIKKAGFHNENLPFYIFSQKRRAFI